MKWILLIFILFLTGCFAVIEDKDKVRTFGLKQEDVLDTLKRIDAKEEKRQVWPRVETPREN